MELGANGYKIIESLDITQILSTEIENHVRLKQHPADHVDLKYRKKSDYLFINHNLFKDKRNRIFNFCISEKLSIILLEWLSKHNINGDFITDEEGLGYPNIYFRVVRAGIRSDVGHIHADKWFWDTQKIDFPRTHERFKVWIPIIQNDNNPSLKIFPGSQNSDFSYEIIQGNDGKIRPYLQSEIVERSLISAPVHTGTSIVFHDRLLHAGVATDANRLSVEFTVAIKI